MKHPKLTPIGILAIIACLLLAPTMPALAYHPDAGLASFIESFKGSDGKNGKLAAKMARVRVPFVANEGQVDENVKFYAKTFGGTVFVTKDGKIVYNLPFYEKEKKEGELTELLGENKEKKITKGIALYEELVNGKVNHIGGEKAAATKVTYLNGRNKSKSVINTSAYGMVNLGEVYEGVNLKLRTYGNNVEKLFFVQPGADASVIRLKLDGADGLNLNKNGELEIETELGSVSFTAPLAYQETDGKARNIKVSYVVEDKVYGFMVGDYDKTKELLIDPLLASTFIGGNDFDFVYSMGIDGNGNVYISGSTSSDDFPTTPGAYSDTHPNGSAYISKLDSDLATLLASTFLSIGNILEYNNALAFDQSGNVYVTGIAATDPIPATSGAYDEILDGGTDIFVLKMDSDLTTVLVSTYLGGSNIESSPTLVVDQNGNVYIAGTTNSTDFPTTFGAYDETILGSSDFFVSKLNGDLTTLLASTYIGGSSTDALKYMGVDQNGDVYLTGNTGSYDFPTTPGAYDEIYDSGSDVFVSKFSSDLTTLSASTFLGGSDNEEASSLAIDQNGNVYITGETFSTSFPSTSGAYDEIYSGGGDVFISKLNSDLTSLLSSTFLGVAESDSAGSIILDLNGNVFITGATRSTDFPTTPGAYREVISDGLDLFISKMDSNLTNIIASTFLGGDDFDDGKIIALDQSGNVYVAGDTTSPDFPTTPNAHSQTFQSLPGEPDLFVLKIDSALSYFSHFTTIWSDNPNNRMKLWTFSATIDGVDLAVDDQIGVFDGLDCVGVGTVTAPITTQNPLVIDSSMDDGEGNGFTEGNEITFKIWDASEQREITLVTPQFLTLGTGDPISPPTFERDSDYGLELAGFKTESQTISLTNGWNIFSVRTTPIPADMLSVLQPLIDAGALMRVQDEGELAVQEVLGSWNNQIGDIDPLEGYKIKVAGAIDLVVEGTEFALPVDIPLSSGWNFIGYPSTTPRDAQTVFQPLIDAGFLEKVIDETGATLIMVLGSWVNQIGDMRAGEGYVVKVNSATSVTIDDATPRRRSPRMNENVSAPAASPSHFIPVWSGWPNRRMNLWIEKVIDYKLLPGDEIGVFDGEVCVGVGVVNDTISRWNLLTIMTSQGDDGTGFVEGRPVEFRIWRAGKDLEVGNVIPEYFDITTGDPVEPPVFEGNSDYGVRLWVEE